MISRSLPVVPPIRRVPDLLADALRAGHRRVRNRHEYLLFTTSLYPHRGGAGDMASSPGIPPGPNTETPMRST